MGRLAVVWLAFTACAQAGAPGGPVDAPGTTGDGPKLADARAIDATMAGGTCASSATCGAAMDLGTVSGDTGAATVMASGYQSAWYKVRVTEDDSDVFGIKLSFTATLVSPASAKYQLFVYVNTGSDVVECTTPTGTVTTNGATDTNYIIWGEGTFSNGNDDSRTVSIEVRGPASGCAAASTWQLHVQGDT